MTSRNRFGFESAVNRPPKPCGSGACGTFWNATIGCGKSFAVRSGGSCLRDSVLTGLIGVGSSGHGDSSHLQKRVSSFFSHALQGACNRFRVNTLCRNGYPFWSNGVLSVVMFKQVDRFLDILFKGRIEMESFRSRITRQFRLYRSGGFRPKRRHFCPAIRRDETVEQHISPLWIHSPPHSAMIVSRGDRSNV